MFVLYITAKAIIYLHISFFQVSSPLSFPFNLLSLLSCVEASLAAQICRAAKTASEIISEIYVEQERRQDSSPQDTIHNTRTAHHRKQLTTPGQLSIGHNTRTALHRTQLTTPGQLAGQLSTIYNTRTASRTAIHNSQHQDS